MNPFSKVFVISLDNEVGRARMEITKNHFDGHQIEFEVFKATAHDRGAWGLLWTMKRLFVKCVVENLDNVLIFEDDAKLVVPFWPFIEEVWPQLPKNYHCLCLGTNLLSVPEKITDNILRIRSAYATHAIVYSLEAIKLILGFLDANPTTLPYDIVLMKELQTLQKSYCTRPQMCFQRPGFSSIENGETDWETHSAFTFKAHTFNI